MQMSPFFVIFVACVYAYAQRSVSNVQNFELNLMSYLFLFFILFWALCIFSKNNMKIFMYYVKLILLARFFICCGIKIFILIKNIWYSYINMHVVLDKANQSLIASEKFPVASRDLLWPNNTRYTYLYTFVSGNIEERTKKRLS